MNVIGGKNTTGPRRRCNRRSKKPSHGRVRGPVGPQKIAAKQKFRRRWWVGLPVATVRDFPPCPARSLVGSVWRGAGRWWYAHDRAQTFQSSIEDLTTVGGDRKHPHFWSIATRSFEPPGREDDPAQLFPRSGRSARAEEMGRRAHLRPALWQPGPHAPSGRRPRRLPLEPPDRKAKNRSPHRSTRP